VREGIRLAKNTINTLAKILRHNQTEIEGYLWQYLRDRRLGGYKFRRQHPLKKYILDLYCPEKKLAVELDGGQHDTIQQIEYDQKRTASLEKEGIKVLRYWDNEVIQNTNGVLDDILEELKNRK
jgi:very-short-patch-repair endonuclease